MTEQDAPLRTERARVGEQRMTAIGVLAEAPLPGRCLPGLLTAHAPEWVAGLCAAMLRDTLDGLLSLTAHRYVVFGAADDLAILARHVPAPWEIATATDLASALTLLGPSAVVARSDAPTAPVDPIANALRVPLAIGPTPTGEAWVVVVNDVELGGVPWHGPETAAALRVRAAKASVPLVDLPTSTVITQPSAVLDLLDELRRHPERAPRTAQYLVTRG